MKTVGKQLEEARLAKNWTPELAARETKIKIERLKDLETDDYSNFTSPTYARGFVRTYARALGLDEYKILRQLDSKLPDDDSSNIVTDTGVAYLPETSLPPRAAHRDHTGLYVVMGLGAVVTLAIVFVLFEAYRVGELQRWFASNDDSTTSVLNSSSTNAARALPIDGNAPPPIPVETTNTVATESQPPVAAPVALPVAQAVTNADIPPNAPKVAPITPPRALPVDAAFTGEGDASAKNLPPPRALPVNPSDTVSTGDNPAPVKAAPRALPVNPTDAVPTTDNVPVGSAADPAPPVTPAVSSKGFASKAAPRALPVIDAPAPAQPVAAEGSKPLILIATQDSFVRVTDPDSSSPDKPLYAAVLRSGQQVAFSGHKFSINVGVPSAVAIKLDGVNYGPHSVNSQPETFTVTSHVQ